MRNKTDIDDIDSFITDPLTKGGYYGTAIYLSVLIIIALIGNILIVCAFYHNRQLRMNVHNWLLINVAIADLGIALIGYSCAMTSGYVGRWIFGPIGCTVYGFFCFTFSQTDMNSLAILAIYRYIIVCKPQWKYKLSIPNTMYAILISWLYSLLWSVPPLIGWSRYVPEPFGTSCSIHWTSAAAADVTYTIVLCFTCYALHLVIIGYCYLQVWKVWMRTKASLAASRVQHRQWTIHTISNANRIGLLSSMKVNKRLATASFVFLLIWAPYVFVCLWSVYDPSRPGWVTTLPTMFAKATCAVNPVLYAGFNENFRHAIRRMLGNRCEERRLDNEEVISMRVQNAQS